MFSLDNAFVWVCLCNVSGVVLTAAVEGEVSDELLRESGDGGMGRMMLSRPRRRQQGEGESGRRGLSTGKTSGASDQARRSQAQSCDRFTAA